MKPFLIVILTAIFTNTFSQDSIGFVDLHVHTTLKHFSKQVHDPYDVINKPAPGLFSSNWNGKRFSKGRERSSDFKTTQSDYTRIANGNYSIVTASIAPAEKAHLDSWVKRLIARMGGFGKAVKSRRDISNTPFEYFNSELFYQVNQKMVSIGSDYDGLVDPLDICLNSDELGKFESLAIEYLPVYLKHEKIDTALLYGLTPRQAMRKVFRTNAYNFILKYF